MVENSTTKQEKPIASPNLNKTWFIVLPLISLAAAAALLLAGIIVWKGNQGLLQQNADEIVALKSSLTDMNAQMLQDKQVAQKQQIRLNAFLNTQSEDNINWQLGEARYLIHLANFSVSFEHNVPVAIELLKTADSRIATLDDTDFLPMRQALANDITALEGVPQADMANILLQLNALGDQINKLPVISTPNAVPQAAPPKHHHQPGWKRGLAQSWQELKQIIVVQYHDQPVGQLITPQNRNYLDLHLQMLLSQAEWACLHQEGALYTSSITQAIEWVKNYYVESAPQTQAMLSSLTTLQGQIISPPLPNISDSLQIINTLLDNLPMVKGAKKA
ncbi:MAG: hypothetical protein HKM04_05040 [Legionellales bacterium]|nr:hypothetical protein [Legionellales bacterium]